MNDKLHNHAGLSELQQQHADLRARNETEVGVYVYCRWYGITDAPSLADARGRRRVCAAEAA
jgi:hypothetical protein